MVTGRMSATALSAAGRTFPQLAAPRAAYLGSPVWLGTSAPPVADDRVMHVPVPRGEVSPSGEALACLRAFAPAVCVVFEPFGLDAAMLASLPGTTLGVLVHSTDGELGGLGRVAVHLDRILSFRPVLSGAALRGLRVWRAIPPPIADGWFTDQVHLSHGRPLALTIGRSTPHREALLLPAKHHHDVMQLVHGVEGVLLQELLADHDVAIYAPPRDVGGFGAQVGVHLAAAQLLFAEGLTPLHGLEPGLDYVPFSAPEELVMRLDRLARFPEMLQRVRIRGRMKAESFRASRLFARVLGDLLGDVEAFGSGRG